MGAELVPLFHDPSVKGGLRMLIGLDARLCPVKEADGVRIVSLPRSLGVVLISREEDIWVGVGCLGSKGGVVMRVS